jgi:hypothetical protein
MCVSSSSRCGIVTSQSAHFCTQQMVREREVSQKNEILNVKQHRAHAHRHLRGGRGRKRENVSEHFAVWLVVFNFSFRTCWLVSDMCAWRMCLRKSVLRV